MDVRQAVLVFCTATILVGFLCWVFSKIIALRSPPTRRASWTAGLAYVSATFLFWAGAEEENAVWAPISAVPGTAYFFWVFFKDFREAWIADTENVAEGVTLANDDWRVGALWLAGVFVLFLAIGIGGRLGQELGAWLMQ